MSLCWRFAVSCAMAALGGLVDRHLGIKEGHGWFLWMCHLVLWMTIGGLNWNIMHPRHEAGDPCSICASKRKCKEIVDRMF